MIIKLNKEKNKLTKKEIIEIANRSYFQKDIKDAVKAEIKYLAKK